MNVHEFFEKYQVAMTYENDHDYIDNGTWDKEARHYKCVLMFEDREFAFEWHCGKLANDPDIDQVLIHLAMECRDVNHCETFEEWADSLGYDNDSRYAERIYNTTCKHLSHLQDLFGDKIMREFSEIEEE